jgi:hypothetical protein
VRHHGLARCPTNKEPIRAPGGQCEGRIARRILFKEGPAMGKLREA